MKIWSRLWHGQTVTYFVSSVVGKGLSVMSIIMWRYCWVLTQLHDFYTVVGKGTELYRVVQWNNSSGKLSTDIQKILRYSLGTFHLLWWVVVVLAYFISDLDAVTYFSCQLSVWSSVKFVDPSSLFILLLHIAASYWDSVFYSTLSFVFYTNRQNIENRQCWMFWTSKL